MESIRPARLGKPAARLAGNGRMIQITAQMRVLVAIEPVDGRKGIDSLARLDNGATRQFQRERGAMDRPDLRCNGTNPRPYQPLSLRTEFKAQENY